MVTMCVANHYSMEIQFINVVCLFLILIVHAEAQSKLYVHTLGHSNWIISFPLTTRIPTLHPHAIILSMYLMRNFNIEKNIFHLFEVIIYLAICILT